MSDFNPDNWLTEGGIDDTKVALRNVVFTRDVEYQDGQTPFLSIDLVPLDGEMTPFTGQRFGVGAGWDEDEAGASITRNDGKRAQYNKASKAGRLTNSLMELPSFMAEVKKRWDAGDQVTPFDARFFEGITGTVKANAGHFKAKDSGEDVTFTYYTMVDFDGYEGSTTTAKPAKKAAVKKAASKKAAAKKAEVAEVVEPEPTPEPATSDSDNLTALRDALTAHASNSTADTHDEWMMEAYEQFADDLSTDAAAALVDDPAAVWDVVWAE
jgi:flagellar hook-associated protein FlgK